MLAKWGKWCKHRMKCDLSTFSREESCNAHSIYTSGTVHVLKTIISQFVLTSPLPDSRAWKVCTLHSTAAWWLHEHCTPSLLRSSSFCFATGRQAALPTLPFPAPLLLPSLLQVALNGDEIKPYLLCNHSSIQTVVSFTGARTMIHAIPTTNLLPGSLLIKPFLNVK